MTRQIIILLLFFGCLHAWGQSTLIMFDKNSDVITLSNKSILDAFILDIKKGDKTEEIGVVGHTDKDASDEYNKILSFKRAKAVRDYLIGNGLINQIHIDSKGETEQINKNEAEVDKAKNRRVQITRNYSKNNCVFGNFDSAFQIHTINQRRDTLVKCKLGTCVKIEKNIFQTSDSLSSITIKIQEFNSKKAFVLSNLTTHTVNNELLESRGMLNIEAYQNEKQVELKVGKEIGILFPDRKPHDKTELFNGVTHNENIVWNNPSDRQDLTETRGSSWTLVAGDTVFKSKWEYAEIDGETFKITIKNENGKVTYDTTSVENEKLAKDLVLNSKKLGWINCDKFYNDNSKKIDLIVKYTGAFVPNVVAVFQNVNSVLPYSYREDNKLIFKNIPSDQDIVFIGLFKLKNSDKILFAQKRIRSKEGLVETITFDKLNAEEVVKKMNVL